MQINHSNHFKKLHPRFRAAAAFALVGCTFACSATDTAPQTDAGQPPTTNTGGATATGGVTSNGGDSTGGIQEFSTGGTIDVAQSDFCAALDVVQRNCQNCHGAVPKFGAPMPLVSHADMTTAKSLSGTGMTELIATRIHATNAPMPPPPATMTDEDKAALTTWIDGGALPGDDPKCGDNVTVTGTGGSEQTNTDDWPAECEDIYTVHTSSKSDPSKPYIVDANTEEHPQFIFDAPWGDDAVQILATRPIVDNAKVLHHWILYENGGRIGKFLVGWAPGKTAGDPLPDDVGIYVPSGPKSLRLDMHYYNLGNDSDEPDRSGLEICVTRKFRKHTASVIGLFGNASVPPNSKVDNASTCTADTSDEVHFLSVSPHMHKYGRNGKLELIRDGETTTLHDKPFDFEDQQVWPLDNLEIKSGDKLVTTCSYENSTGNRIGFGQDSDDEMCFNFILYYPMGALDCGRSI